LGIFRRDLPLIRSIEHALNLEPGDLHRGVPLLQLLAQVPKTFPEATKAARVTALIHCMVSTGFAIRDTIQPERGNIRDGWLRIKREKTAERFSRNWVVRRIKNCCPWPTGILNLYSGAGRIKGNLSHRFRDTAVDF
jgi:hypothetical protein